MDATLIRNGITTFNHQKVSYFMLISACWHISYIKYHMVLHELLLTVLSLSKNQYIQSGFIQYDQCPIFITNPAYCGFRMQIICWNFSFYIEIVRTYLLMHRKYLTLKTKKTCISVLNLLVFILITHRSILTCLYLHIFTLNSKNLKKYCCIRQKNETLVYASLFLFLYFSVYIFKENNNLWVINAWEVKIIIKNCFLK